MDTTIRDETAYLEMVQDRNVKIQQLQKELEEQKEKLERVQKQVSTSDMQCYTIYTQSPNLHNNFFI